MIQSHILSSHTYNQVTYIIESHIQWSHTYYQSHTYNITHVNQAIHKNVTHINISNEPITHMNPSNECHTHESIKWIFHTYESIKWVLHTWIYLFTRMNQSNLKCECDMPVKCMSHVTRMDQPVPGFNCNTLQQHCCNACNILQRIQKY